MLEQWIVQGVILSTSTYSTWQWLYILLLGNIYIAADLKTKVPAGTL